MTTSNAFKIDSDLQAELGVNQYLTFFLGGEEYGVNILKVQEIKGWTDVTPMPNTPDPVLGVINLRGTVVPIVELRSYFNLPKAARGATTVIIVVKVEDGRGGTRTLGMVVDSVSEVHNIPGDEIQPPPIGEENDRGVIEGLATVGERMIILLDIDDLMLNGVLGLTRKTAEIHE